MLFRSEKKTFRGAAYFNLPLSDNIALSVSGERQYHGAYTKNLAQLNPYSAANFPGTPATGGLTFLPTGPGGAFAPNTPAQTAAFFNSRSAVPKLDDKDLWSINAKLLVKLGDNFKITIAGDYARKSDREGLQTWNETPAIPAGLVQIGRAHV